MMKNRASEEDCLNPGQLPSVKL